MYRLPGLDLLRAIAIVWVMLFHAYALFGLGTGFAWLSGDGWMGVDIFFVLSGFLIGGQVLQPLQRGERLSFGKFYARRAWRILPAFAVVLALYAGFPALREAAGMAPWWQFATFTMNLSIDYRHQQAFSQAWSLCVEEHFYLLFPLLAWWLTRKPSAIKFVSVCAGVVLLGVVLRGAVWWHDAGIVSPRNWYVEDIYYPTWMRLDGLLMGVMLAVLRVYRPQLWSRWQLHANAVLLAGVGLSVLALWLFRDRTGLLANAVGWPLLSWGLGVVVFAAVNQHSVIGRWRLPGAGWIAAISYSLYLSHKIALHLVQVAWGVQLQRHGAGALVAYVGAILLLGAALHYLVERPFLRMRDRRRMVPEAIADSVLGQSPSTPIPPTQPDRESGTDDRMQAMGSQGELDGTYFARRNMKTEVIATSSCSPRQGILPERRARYAALVDIVSAVGDEYTHGRAPSSLASSRLSAGVAGRLRPVLAGAGDQAVVSPGLAAGESRRVRGGAMAGAHGKPPALFRSGLYAAVRVFVRA